MQFHRPRTAIAAVTLATRMAATLRVQQDGQWTDGHGHAADAIVTIHGTHLEANGALHRVGAAAKRLAHGRIAVDCPNMAELSGH